MHWLGPGAEDNQSDLEQHMLTDRSVATIENPPLMRGGRLAFATSTEGARYFCLLKACLTICHVCTCKCACTHNSGYNSRWRLPLLDQRLRPWLQVSSFAGDVWGSEHMLTTLPLWCSLGIVQPQQEPCCQQASVMYTHKPT